MPSRNGQIVVPCNKRMAPTKALAPIGASVIRQSPPAVSLGEGLVDGARGKVEGIKQIVERRHVGGNVGVALFALRIGEIVAAAIGQRLEVPVALDEL